LKAFFKRLNCFSRQPVFSSIFSLLTLALALAITLKVEINADIGDQVIVNDDGYEVYTNYFVVGVPAGVHFSLLAVLSEVTINKKGLFDFLTIVAPFIVDGMGKGHPLMTGRFSHVFKF